MRWVLKQLVGKPGDGAETLALGFQSEALDRFTKQQVLGLGRKPRAVRLLIASLEMSVEKSGPDSRPLRFWLSPFGSRRAQPMPRPGLE